MKRFFSLVLTVLLLAAAPSAFSREGSIAVVVNSEAISTADVEARTKLILVSSGMPRTAEMKERIQPQIISALVDESLMMQEAARLNITVSPSEIDAGFAALAQQNNMTSEQFQGILRREGIPAKTLRDQIAAQSAWGRVVQKEVRPRVAVTESEIDAFLARISVDAGKTQYFASEIFLPVESPKEEGNVRQLADKLAREMKENRASFPKVAQQFSQAASASRGGDMGWVAAGQLPQELDEALAAMKEGEISRPLRSMTGFHVLLLKKKSTLSAETMPAREEVYNKLGLEQLDRMQRRYLLDLKAAAFIENRAGS